MMHNGCIASHRSPLVSLPLPTNLLKPVQIKVAVSNCKQPTLMERGGSRQPGVSQPLLRAATARPGLERKAAASRRTPEFPPIYPQASIYSAEKTEITKKTGTTLKLPFSEGCEGKRPSTV
jgi:hypothetical protein